MVVFRIAGVTDTGRVFDMQMKLVIAIRSLSQPLSDYMEKIQGKCGLQHLSGYEWWGLPPTPGFKWSGELIDPLALGGRVDIAVPLNATLNPISRYPAGSTLFFCPRGWTTGEQVSGATGSELGAPTPPPRPPRRQSGSVASEQLPVPPRGMQPPVAAPNPPVPPDRPPDTVAAPAPPPPPPPPP
eukprot:Hpha_TRINITY_DN16378_c0_g6::TRINITY_DN16378_c0_g6_i1::g.61306::m.61306